MEFLLINHPLDCPICDQGGECELQDLAMGFGRDVSRYSERKRVVKDKNLGPLVSTDMTRCIHCTRCVRFGQEIAGIPELGTIGRGEHDEICTFIEQSVDHELSGQHHRPVPGRRAQQQAVPLPRARLGDDAGAAGLAARLRRHQPLRATCCAGGVMRVVPRANDAINETWIADRDRFSYEGIYSADRAQKPMVRPTAPGARSTGRRRSRRRPRACSRSCATPARRRSACWRRRSHRSRNSRSRRSIARGLGTANLDHRLRRVDFRDQANDPAAPLLGCTIAELEQARGVAGRRLEPAQGSAAARASHPPGAPCGAARRSRSSIRAPTTCASRSLAELTSNGLGMAQHLAAVLVAALRSAGQAGAGDAARGARGRHADGAARGRRGARSRRATCALMLLGALAQRHAAYAEIRALAAALAAADRRDGSATCRKAATPSARRWPACCRTAPWAAAPSRRRASTPRRCSRRASRPTCWSAASRAPTSRRSPTADASLRGAECVVAITPYASADILATATVILPSAVFAETSGTWVNVEGRWQSVAGAARPAGEARPAWKILRVLGNLLGLAGFDYASSEDVRDELRRELDGLHGRGVGGRGPFAPGRLAAFDVDARDRLYRVDAIVRRSAPLQATADGQAGRRRRHA